MGIGIKNVFLVLGFTAIAFGFILRFAYIWPVGGDGNLYLDLFYHEKVSPPHGYRLILPYFLSFIGNDPIFLFSLIKYFSLLLNSFFVFYILQTFNFTHQINITGLLIWLFSFPCIYYLTTVVRVDPILFPCISFIYILTHVYKNYFLAFLFAYFLTLIHEMAAIILLYLSAHLINNKENFTIAFLFIILTAVSFFLMRFFIDLPRADILPFYLDNPLGMIKSSLSKTDGFFGMLIRFYSAYGPLLLFALTFLLINFKKFQSTIVLTIGLFLLCFFAIDTLRVASVIFIFILIPGIFFLNNLKKYSNILFYFSVFIQIIYSLIIFFQLNEINQNFMMLYLGALISIMSLIPIIYYFIFEQRNNFNKGKYD